jgi:hypothetical protein
VHRFQFAKWGPPYKVHRDTSGGPVPSTRRAGETKTELGAGAPATSEAPAAPFDYAERNGDQGIGPARNHAPGAGPISTGPGANRTTRSATLPMTRWGIAPAPMRSHHDEVGMLVLPSGVNRMIRQAR